MQPTTTISVVEPVRRISLLIIELLFRFAEAHGQGPRQLGTEARTTIQGRAGWKIVNCIDSVTALLGRPPLLHVPKILTPLPCHYRIRSDIKGENVQVHHVNVVDDFSCSCTDGAWVLEWRFLYDIHQKSMFSFGLFDLFGFLLVHARHELHSH